MDRINEIHATDKKLKWSFNIVSAVGACFLTAASYLQSDYNDAREYAQENQMRICLNQEAKKFATTPDYQENDFFRGVDDCVSDINAMPKTYYKALEYKDDAVAFGAMGIALGLGWVMHRRRYPILNKFSKKTNSDGPGCD